MNIDANVFNLFKYVSNVIESYNKTAGDFNRFDEEIKLMVVRDFVESVFGLRIVLDTTKSQYLDDIITDWKIEKI